ncbi:MAG: peroxiredoxin [Pyrinomonadaceae bacterium]
MKIGSKAPEFSLRDGNGEEWKLSDHRGKVVVLLFYPADNSPVCTKQLCSVRDNWEDYTATGAEVVGISTDSSRSHASFAEEHELPLRLLADEDGEVSRKYDAGSWIPGKSARAVVVIDKEGKVASHDVQSLGIFRPKDEDVLAAIRAAG